MVDSKLAIIGFTSLLHKLRDLMVLPHQLRYLKWQATSHFITVRALSTHLVNRTVFWSTVQKIGNSRNWCFEPDNHLVDCSAISSLKRSVHSGTFRL